jgi:hypothetical protein
LATMITVSGVLKILCATWKYCETSPWDFAVPHVC